MSALNRHDSCFLLISPHYDLGSRAQNMIYGYSHYLNYMPHSFIYDLSADYNYSLLANRSFSDCLYLCYIAAYLQNLIGWPDWSVSVCRRHCRMSKPGHLRRSKSPSVTDRAKEDGGGVCMAAEREIEVGDREEVERRAHDRNLESRGSSALQVNFDLPCDWAVCCTGLGSCYLLYEAASLLSN